MATININLVRQQTARLLATENITVRQDPKAPTAYFNLKSRELVLPVWRNMSNELYDMLVGHEVGHALYTPGGNGGWLDSAKSIARAHGVESVPQAVEAATKLLNIVEDARIERLIQVRYPGLRRDFTIAYRELHGRDIFGLATIGSDLSKLGLPDRLNLHFKIGLHTAVPFSAEEQVFVSRMTDAVSWEEVVAIAADLYKWEVDHGNATPVVGSGTDSKDSKDSKDSEDSEDSDDGEPLRVKKALVKRNAKPQGKGKGKRVEAEEIEYIDGEEGEDGEDGEEGEESQPQSKNSKKSKGKASGEPQDGDADGDADGEGEEDGEKSAEHGEGSKAPFVPNAPVTADALDDAQRSMREGSAVERNYVAVAKPKDLRDWIVPNSLFVEGFRTAEKDNRLKPEVAAVDKAWESISAGSKDTVTEFVQEFERRKAADEHRRAVESKTGRIDTNSLWRSTLTDDVFRTMTITRDGKNHGFVVFIDWSSSMASNMQQTLKQLYILGSFCRKVGVPFEAYAFGGSVCGDVHRKMEAERNGWRKHTPTKDNEIVVNDCLIHILSGASSARDWRDSFRGCLSATRNLGGFGLGGYTPLGQACVLARPVVEAFRAATKVQVVNTVFLTDGEANDGALTGHARRYGSYGAIHVLRDGSQEWSAGNHNENDITVLVNWLRDTTGSRVLGIFVGEFDYAVGYMEAGSPDRQKRREEFNKNGWCAVRALGFDQFFVLSGRSKTQSGIGDALGGKMSAAQIQAASLDWLRSRNAHRGMVTSLARTVAAAV